MPSTDDRDFFLQFCDENINQSHWPRFFSAVLSEPQEYVVYLKEQRIAQELRTQQHMLRLLACKYTMAPLCTSNPLSAPSL